MHKAGKTVRCVLHLSTCSGQACVDTLLVNLLVKLVGQPFAFACRQRNLGGVLTLFIGSFASIPLLSSCNRTASADPTHTHTHAHDDDMYVIGTNVRRKASKCPERTAYSLSSVLRAQLRILLQVHRCLYIHRPSENKQNKVSLPLCPG
jgi:hypothetical protein